MVKKNTPPRQKKPLQNKQSPRFFENKMGPTKKNHVTLSPLSFPKTFLQKFALKDVKAPPLRDSTWSSQPFLDPWKMVYLPTWILDFYGFHVGKYTSPMDPQGKMESIPPMKGWMAVEHCLLFVGCFWVFWLTFSYQKGATEKDGFCLNDKFPFSIVFE